MARTQTEEVLSLLRRVRPAVQAVVHVIRTAGDRDRSAPLAQIGGRGVFARELEAALLDERIDVAIHSLKDLPPEQAPGLAIAAVPPRADPRDALVSRDSITLDRLPAGSRIGTSSARRRALLQHLRPDVEVVEVRGNVDTRIRKVRSGELDAAVLAAAGLRRLDRLDEAAEIFPIQLMPPAPGQGALAVQVRADDLATREVVSAVDDGASHLCARAERSFLGRLGAGCTLPVAAYAAVEDDTIEIEGMMASLDGRTVLRERLGGSHEQAETLGRALAERLLTADGGRLTGWTSPAQRPDR